MYFCVSMCVSRKIKVGGVLGTVGHVPVLAEMDLTHNLWKQ